MTKCPNGKTCKTNAFLFEFWGICATPVLPVQNAGGSKANRLVANPTDGRRNPEPIQRNQKGTLNAKEPFQVSGISFSGSKYNVEFPVLVTFSKGSWTLQLPNTLRRVVFSGANNAFRHFDGVCSEILCFARSNQPCARRRTDVVTIFLGICHDGPMMGFVLL